MIGIVLGLGFQWWPNLHETWQYIAFIFVYLSIIDYWIDTAGALKKYPPKREIDVMLDVAIMFLLFLYIYATQITIAYLLTIFIIFRVFDAFWILRVKNEYKTDTHDTLVMNTWLISDTFESAVAAALIGVSWSITPPPLIILTIFIAFIFAVRIWSSFRYRRVYFV